MDAITGEALANHWNSDMKWEDSAKLIGELHGEGASDELLVTFLSVSGHQAWEHRDAAVQMALKIKDEGKREEVLQKLGGQPVKRIETIPSR
ncbi:MAG: hypothetical protein B9S38_07690 [Verrucomicrobiia bacterium Tous-C4TDCM]|nr:MAG: hypothetical protein B9S38_07690 [Verrucomicrobiae bacterium Tous-C4TDCM]